MTINQLIDFTQTPLGLVALGVALITAFRIRGIITPVVIFVAGAWAFHRFGEYPPLLWNAAQSGVATAYSVINLLLILHPRTYSGRG